MFSVFSLFCINLLVCLHRPVCLSSKKRSTQRRVFLRRQLYWHLIGPIMILDQGSVVASIVFLPWCYWGMSCKRTSRSKRTRYAPSFHVKLQGCILLCIFASLCLYIDLVQNKDPFSSIYILYIYIDIDINAAIHSSTLQLQL